MRTLFSLTLALLLLPELVAAQTGRIDGTVTDAQTGETLIGANVIIEGTTLGAATNLEGYYSILNVPPGTHSLRFSMVGFATTTVEEVRVSINQTTTIDVQLREEELIGEEIVVQAVRPIVQRDVAASTVNISAREIEAIPVSSVTQVIGLQAGIQGLTIRGSDSDQLAFQLDGFGLRDERSNTPFTGISLTAVEEIQIQTGGFNAEYGNVRSGVINVVTREGSRTRYSSDILVRFTPPQPKHFGPAPNDPNSYWMRPYLDPEVAWTGTQNWPEHIRDQYPTFEGWIRKTESLRSGDNPQDLTPLQAQQLFLWQMRKDFAFTQPDYELDMSFGGPVPGVSRMLGDARFFATYRRTQDMYFIPLATDRYEDESVQLKITSDVGPGMKLNIAGLYGEVSGTNLSRSGLPGIFRSPGSIARHITASGPFSAGGVGFIDTRIYSSDYWTPTNVRRFLIGAKLSHALSANTFYEASLQRFSSQYNTNPGRMRDTSAVFHLGGVAVNEAPFGWWPFNMDGVSGSVGISEMRMAVGMGNSRDSSFVATYQAKFDITSQLNRYNQIKSGFEAVLTDSRVNYAQIDLQLPAGNAWSVWNTEPLRAAAYVQNKLEYQAMVANLGLRLELSDPRTPWYIIEDPYDPALGTSDPALLDSLLERERPRRNLTLSPRLGISFPVTDDSKLYFNYGHFRSMPTPENLFLIRRELHTGDISRLADPNNPIPRTVAYELGYEHSLFDMLLLRIAGYYRDVDLQPRLVRYVSRGGRVNYQISEPNNYQDTRGFEFTIQKRPTRFFSGFLNYTYMVSTSGNFGFREVHESASAMREFLDDNPREHYQSRPVPRPYARLNLDLFTPVDFGPRWGDMRPLADWRLNLLAVYNAGLHFTWVGGGSHPVVQNNVQWRSFYDVTARLSRTFNVAGTRAQFFLDVDNLLNTRYLQYGFVDASDYLDYMTSLHLPADFMEGQPAPYINIPGNDRPGDFRRPGVEFVPIETSANVTNIREPNPDILYWDALTSQYMRFRDGSWVQEDADRVNQILQDKAYIDMPNQGFLHFLNPRRFTVGFRVSI